MKTKIKKTYSLLREIKKYINNVDYIFMNVKEFNNENDLIHDLPRVSHIDKYGYYNEFAVMSISNGEIYALGIGENFGDEFEMFVDDIQAFEALWIAEEICQ